MGHGLSFAFHCKAWTVLDLATHEHQDGILCHLCTEMIDFFFEIRQFSMFRIEFTMPSFPCCFTCSRKDSNLLSERCVTWYIKNDATSESFLVSKTWICVVILQIFYTWMGCFNPSFSMMILFIILVSSHDKCSIVSVKGTPYVFFLECFALTLCMT